MADQKTTGNEKGKAFPGYPHYPDNEDVMRNIKVDDEELDMDNDIVMGTEADVTQEDIELLDHAEENMNTADDVNLIKSGLDHVDADGDPLNEDGADDFTGDDLDVPGSELDEKAGEEDEENNYYSLGGDDKEGLEDSNLQE